MFKTLVNVSPPKCIGNTRSVCIGLYKTYTHTLRVLPFTSAAERYPVVKDETISRLDWIWVFWESHQSSSDCCKKMFVDLTTLTSFFYSYCELSVKEGERARRVEKAIGIIGVMAIAEEIFIQQQIQKFWASSKNKENIQLLAK